jgi:uncharacterized protein (UPF0548 family)
LRDCAAGRRTGPPGEEAFIVRRGLEGGVTFAITAFSRPRHLLSRLGSPLTRRIQLQTTRAYLSGLMAFVTGDG